MSEVVIGWFDAIEVAVRCAGQRHVLVWTVDGLRAADHPDPERERALVALGGAPNRCLDLLDAWDRHADDLDVLVLATRGVTDTVRIDRVDPDDDDIGVVRPGVHYHGRYRPMRRANFGWQAYSPLHGHHHHGAQDRGIESLLTLDGRLADRLVLSVVRTWSARLAADDARVPEARAALRAALYGRVTRVVRDWLGDQAQAVEVRLLAPGGTPAVTRDAAGTVHVALEFGWLAEVWLAGGAVTLGRLCLRAEPLGATDWSLVTVGRDLGEPRTMRVTW